MKTLHLIDRISEHLHIWLERHDVRDRLAVLSDRELADIGLSRNDIEAVARGTYQRTRATAH